MVLGWPDVQLIIYNNCITGPLKKLYFSTESSSFQLEMTYSFFECCLIFPMFQSCIFQTATSIQEQTLAFIPKIIAVFIAIIVFGSWIMNVLVTYTTNLYSSFNTML